MNFYKSNYTGVEIDKRLAQGTYEDAIKSGFEGTKEEFDALLAKLKETTKAAENAIPEESDKLETFNKNIIDAINELHRDIEAKPDLRDYINVCEFNEYKQEADDKFETKSDHKNDLDGVKNQIKTINNNLTTSINIIDENLVQSFGVVNDALYETNTTLVEEINQRKEADAQLIEELENLKSKDFALKSDIPDKLPNPEKLTIKYNGVEAFNYDGSKEEVGNFIVTAETIPIKEGESITISAKLETKVDKIEGKGLSTEDYTTAEKEKLAGLENYDDSELRNQVQQTEMGVAANLAEIEKLQSGKQDKLICGETLKTINGECLLGSGNLEISGDTNEIYYILRGLAAELNKNTDDFIPITNKSWDYIKVRYSPSTKSILETTTVATGIENSLRIQIYSATYLRNVKLTEGYYWNTVELKWDTNIDSFNFTTSVNKDVTDIIFYNAKLSIYEGSNPKYSCYTSQLFVMPEDEMTFDSMMEELEALQLPEPPTNA